MNIVIKNRLSVINQLLQNHDSLSVLGMPGSGISLLLKELADNNPNQTIYIDVFGLSQLTPAALLEEVEKRLKAVNDKSPITIYFAGFDQLQLTLDANLLQALHNLARRSGIQLVFGLCVSLKKLIPDSSFDSGLRLFGNVYYLHPYAPEELRYLLSKYGPKSWEKNPKLKQYLTDCGGHFQLLLALLETSAVLQDTPSESIQLLFKNLYTHLLGTQRTIIRRVSDGMKRVEPDEYLLGIGTIKKTSNGLELFSPLFRDYLVSLNNKRLPAKERRLFLLLKRNLGQVVSKQTIIDTVWGDEIISDWALNALVYRLRKHPVFRNQGYEIQNHKKFGYVLAKNI